MTATTRWCVVCRHDQGIEGSVNVCSACMKHIKSLRAEVKRLEAIAKAGMDVVNEWKAIRDEVEMVLLVATTTPLDNAEADSDAVRFLRELASELKGMQANAERRGYDIQPWKLNLLQRIDAILAWSGEGQWATRKATTIHDPVSTNPDREGA